MTHQSLTSSKPLLPPAPHLLPQQRGWNKGSAPQHSGVQPPHKWLLDPQRSPTVPWIPVCTKVLTTSSAFIRMTHLLGEYCFSSSCRQDRAL